MQTLTKDIIRLIDKEASFNLAEDWDNSGLQAGAESWPVKRVLIALDPSFEVISEAVRLKADLVLTHHPLFLKLPKNIDFNTMPGKVILISAKEKISIVSAHTNLDKAFGGLNDYFAKKIGLKKIVPLVDIPGNENLSCFGRKGDFGKVVTLKELAVKIKKTLNLNYLRIVGDKNLTLKSAAVITGSGGSMLDSFFLSQADVFITGDVKYHEARMIEEKKSGMIDVGHFGSEHIAIQLLFDKLFAASKEKDYEIIKYENESDPFNIV